MSKFSKLCSCEFTKVMKKKSTKIMLIILLLSLLASVEMEVLAVMIIIIAGASISSERSKETMNFWLCTPNKRWKILLSKLLVNTFILILTTVLITFLNIALVNIFSRIGIENCYLLSGNSVDSIKDIGYAILRNLVIAIGIFIFLLFAMMLSTLTKKTVIAVGVSIIAYFGVVLMKASIIANIATVFLLMALAVCAVIMIAIMFVRFRLKDF